MERILKAAGYSWAGLRSAWQSEPAFRQEVVLCILLAPLAIWLGDTSLERAVMVGSLFIVLIVELINSGLEAVVDRIGSEINPLSKTAKDVGSAAVLLSLLNVVVIWALILL
jgi:diacylglycerol kinase (ATP)